MTRGILIAGNESTLSQAVEAEAARRVEHFAIARIPNRFSEQIRAGSPVPNAEAAVNAPQFVLQWNPGSPLSARTLVLAAENRLEHIDEAILICTPPSIRRAAAELPPADIEILVNDHIKGWFFLVKEVAAIFRARRQGTLALVYAEFAGGGKDEASDLLGPPALASFRSFTQGLLASAFAEPYFTMGFSCSDAGDESGFASFIFKLLDEGNKRSGGKLHKYGKINFFK